MICGNLYCTPCSTGASDIMLLTITGDSINSVNFLEAVVSNIPLLCVYLDTNKSVISNNV